MEVELVTDEENEPIWAWRCEKCEARSEAIYTRSDAEQALAQHDKEIHQ